MQRLLGFVENNGGVPNGIYTVAPDGSHLALVLDGPGQASGLSWQPAG